MRETADKEKPPGQDVGQHTTTVLDGAKAGEFLEPLTVSSGEGKLFAREHAALIRLGENDCIVQQNIVRHLLGGHPLSDQPESADNKWRVSCRPPPPTSLWRALPSFSGMAVPVEVERKDTPVHNDMASCTFWLLATGFDLSHRDVFCTLVRSPDKLSMCPYLGIQHCEKDSGLDQALEHVVVTGSHALYDRLLLRKTAAEAKHLSQGCGPRVVSADGVISYYGITISHTSYKIYRLTAHSQAGIAHCHKSQQDHQPASVSEPLSVSSWPSRSLPAEPSDRGVSLSRPREPPTDRRGGYHVPVTPSRGTATATATQSAMDDPPRRLYTSTSLGTCGPTSTGTGASASQRNVSNNDPWTGCEVAQVGYGDCRDVASLLRLVDWVNEIHKWGQSAHAAAVKADLDAYVAWEYGGEGPLFGH